MNPTAVRQQTWPWTWLAPRYGDVVTFRLSKDASTYYMAHVGRVSVRGAPRPIWSVDAKRCSPEVSSIPVGTLSAYGDHVTVVSS